MNRHALIMVLCCAVPLGLLAAVSVFGLTLGGLSGLIPFLCPLMMILMMRGMGHQHGGQPAPTTQAVIEAKAGTVQAEAPASETPQDRGCCH